MSEILKTPNTVIDDTGEIRVWDDVFSPDFEDEIDEVAPDEPETVEQQEISSNLVETKGPEAPVDARETRIEHIMDTRGISRADAEQMV